MEVLTRDGNASGDETLSIPAIAQTIHIRRFMLCNLPLDPRDDAYVDDQTPR